MSSRMQTAATGTVARSGRTRAAAALISRRPAAARTAQHGTIGTRNRNWKLPRGIAQTAMYAATPAASTARRFRSRARAANGTRMRKAGPKEPPNRAACVVTFQGNSARAVALRPRPNFALNRPSASSVSTDHRMSGFAPNRAYISGNTGFPDASTARAYHGSPMASASIVNIATVAMARWRRRARHSTTPIPTARIASAISPRCLTVIDPPTSAPATNAHRRSPLSWSRQAATAARVMNQASARSTYAVDASHRSVGAPIVNAATATPDTSGATRRASTPAAAATSRRQVKCSNFAATGPPMVMAAPLSSSHPPG